MCNLIDTVHPTFVGGVSILLNHIIKIDFKSVLPQNIFIA